MKIIRPIPPRTSWSSCVGLLGRRRGDVGQDQHVGGLEPRGEEVLLLDDLDPPGLGAPTPIDRGAAR